MIASAGPVAFESGLDRPGTIDEELDGGRGCQPAYRYQDFAGNTERLAAGGHEAKTGHRSDQGVGEARSLVDDVFAVVEDDHERAAGEVAGDELGRRSRGLGVTQGTAVRLRACRPRPGRPLRDR